MTSLYWDEPEGFTIISLFLSTHIYVTFQPSTCTVFSCDQAALRTLISVCLSVRLSVHHTFLTMFLSSYHPEIFRTYSCMTDLHPVENHVDNYLSLVISLLMKGTQPQVKYRKWWNGRTPVCVPRWCNLASMCTLYNNLYTVTVMVLCAILLWWHM